jgi:NAD(P)-dependent dehydrogenase (short-subunit alcohol dehydrogenase family)
MFSLRALQKASDASSPSTSRAKAQRSRTWAAELGETEVRVNLVDPGNMNTAMHRAAEPDEDPRQWADPADVTEVFIYLASDESKGISGRRFEAQKFNVSGA